MKRLFSTYQAPRVRLQLLSYIVCVLSLFLNCDFAEAQVRVPFTQRTSANSPSQVVYKVNGDFTIVGNTNVTVDTVNNPTVINGTINNSNNEMFYVDVDGDPNTENSSSATLVYSNENNAASFPDCYNVVYAGLYWTGRDVITSAGAATVTQPPFSNERRRTIKFKTPIDSTYQTLVANPDDIRYPADADEFIYVGYTEVTEAVQAAGVGEYWVADIAVHEGKSDGVGTLAGWGMVVVYENPRMNSRDVTVFDGYAIVRANQQTDTSYDINIDGFRAISTGEVNVKLGVMACEGDVGINNDYLSIRNASGNFVNLIHSSNTSDNFFNSSINTGGNPKNPDFSNNTGLDISFFELDNTNNQIIANSQTEATFRYGTRGDTYTIFGLALSVQTFITDIEATMTVTEINGAPAPDPLVVVPDDEFDFSLDIKNVGTEAIENFYLTIPIPATAVFIPGSITYEVNSPATTENIPYFDNSLGTNGAVIWDFGALPLYTEDINRILGKLSFNMRATTNCDLLNVSSFCNPTVPLSGGVTGNGAISQSDLDYTLIQGFTITPCGSVPNDDPLVIDIDIDAVDYIQENCSNADDFEWDFYLCSSPYDETIDFNAIASAFPENTVFYSEEVPISDANTIYDENNSFPNTPGITTYLAIIQGSIDPCPYPLTIEIAQVPATVSIRNTTCSTTGGIALSITGDTSYYTYEWSATEGGSGIIQGMQNQNALTTGTYMVTITNTNTLCSLTLDELVVGVDPTASPTITTPSNQTVNSCDALEILNYSEEEVIITEGEFYAFGGALTYYDDVQAITYIDIASDTCPVVLERTYTITDSCGRMAMATQEIQVVDNVAPIFIDAPDADITVYCDAVPPANPPTAVDNCGTSVTLDMEETTWYISDTNYDVVRTWHAQDICGNRSEPFVQRIHVSNDEGVLESTSICVEDAPIDLNTFQPNYDYPESSVWEGDTMELIEEGHFFNPANASPDTVYTYTKNYQDGTCSLETIVSIRVYGDCSYEYTCIDGQENVLISKLVSPNNDGINDVFNVTYNLKPKDDETCDIRVAVKIYNRQGVMVFESMDYQNNWSGNSGNTTSNTSGYLPSGTYYYIVELSGVTFEPIQGFIFLGTK